MYIFGSSLSQLHNWKCVGFLFCKQPQNRGTSSGVSDASGALGPDSPVFSKTHILSRPQYPSACQSSGSSMGRLGSNACAGTFKTSHYPRGPMGTFSLSLPIPNALPVPYHCAHVLQHFIAYMKSTQWPWKLNCSDHYKRTLLIYLRLIWRWKN